MRRRDLVVAQIHDLPRATIEAVMSAEIDHLPDGRLTVAMDLSRPPQVGAVISFCDLWRREFEAGLVEDLKARPCLRDRGRA